MQRHVPTLDFRWTAERIDEATRQATGALLAELDRVAARGPKGATFENGPLAIERALTAFSTTLTVPLFLKYVSDDATVRAAADRCEVAVQQTIVDVFVREDLFAVVDAVVRAKPKLDEADARLLDEQHAGFVRNGLGLPPKDRAAFVAIKKRLVELEAAYSKRLLEWDERVEATPAEVRGIPEGLLHGVERDGQGTYRFELSYPHFNAVMEHAESDALRRRMEAAFQRRGGPDNVKLLEEALQLRDQAAKMLGFPSHAHFVLERRMAKQPESVVRFLDGLRAKLLPRGRTDLAKLLDAKRKRDPSATRIESADWRFYEMHTRREEFSYDPQEVRQYFPAERVVDGMLAIFGKLLDVRFRKSDGPRWHPSVVRYDVLDDAGVRAVFFLDLYPRPGKYGHAAAFTLLPGYVDAEGTYQCPASAMVANFSPPAGGKPSLLDHSEVETLFHEFGHLLHQLLTEARHGSLSGTAVKTDFVEAPSQLLENWAWDRKVLERISGRWDKPEEKLPAPLLSALLASRLHLAGIRYLRQLAFARIDLEYHLTAQPDTTAIYRRECAETMLVPIPDDAIPQASFGHLMGGYDAGYYGYLWAEVFAQDLFTRFEREGLENPTVGRAYRQGILAAGGEKDPNALIESFLGRAPNDAAFLKSLG
jgi:thimet oligopeptidase